MKDSIFESIPLLMIKLVGGIYFLFTSATILSNQFGQWLLKFNLIIDFLYFGLVGQLLATLVAIFRATSNPNYKLEIKINNLIATFVQWFIGPILALVITSLVSNGQHYSPYYALVAICISAFWEIIWKVLKDKTKAKGEFDETNLPDISKGNSEDRPKNGPRQFS